MPDPSPRSSDNQSSPGGPNAALVAIALGVAVAALVHGVATRPGPDAPDRGAGLPPARIERDTALERPAPAPAIEHARPGSSLRETLTEVRQLRRGDATPERNRERVRAILALDQRGEPGQEALWDLALRSPEPFERLTAMNVLWTGEGRERLVELAGSSRDELLRKKVAALQAAEDRAR
jgi:hypothetical protein